MIVKHRGKDLGFRFILPKPWFGINKSEIGDSRFVYSIHFLPCQEVREGGKDSTDFTAR